MSNFGELDLAEMQGEVERLNKPQANFLDQFVPMPKGKGSVVIRLLPPVAGGRLFQYNRIHNINSRKVHCPRPLVGKKWDTSVECAICSYYSSLYRQIDKLKKEGGSKEAIEALEKEARGIKPIERYYYNAIVRSMTVEGELRKNVGPRILSVGKILHQKIISGITGDENRRGLGDVTHIKTGYDFVIKMTMKGEWGDYAESAFSLDPSPLGTPEEISGWCENLHDLTKLRNLKPKEVLEKELAIYLGEIPDDAVGFDRDEFHKKWGSEPNVEEEQHLSSPSSSPKVVVETPVVEEDVSVPEDFLNTIDDIEKSMMG